MAKVRHLILHVTKIVSKMYFSEIKRPKIIMELLSVDIEEASKRLKVRRTQFKHLAELSILDSKVSN